MYLSTIVATLLAIVTQLAMAVAVSSPMACDGAWVDICWVTRKE